MASSVVGAAQIVRAPASPAPRRSRAVA